MELGPMMAENQDGTKLKLNLNLAGKTKPKVMP